MKFKIIVRTPSGRQWEEEYNKETEDPKKWAEDVITNFNNTLKLGEETRTLIDVMILDTNNDKWHHWVKQSMMPVQFRGSMIDLYRCDKCGITGKRYGSSGTIVIDSKYRQKIYKQCNTARAIMSKV